MRRLRDVAIAALAALSAVMGLVRPTASEEAPRTIVTLGDSYINSYGVATAESFAARLRSELEAAGHAVTIVEVGYTATSARGLTWLAQSKDGLDLQANPASHAVIVELGQNDCARIHLDQTRANLDQILTMLGQKSIPVLLVGTAAYTRCGVDYAAPFSKMFSELATKHGDLLYADFKEGVTGHPELLQGDQDHPNAAGDAIIVKNMLPVIEALLERVR
jgi:acyl-CoA thioesterase-1